MLSVGQQSQQLGRLPTLREVDAQQELVNMAAAVLSAVSHNNRELQQQQLQHQQQQYALMLAQAVQQQQQTGLLPTFNLTSATSPLSPVRLSQSHQSPTTFFPFQPASPSSTAQPLFGVSPASSDSQLYAQPPPPPTSTSTQCSRPSSTFILPLAEPADQSGSHDSGLGSGQHLGAGQTQQQQPQPVIRRLQLIGEAPDSSGAGASVNSLHSSDSDRQRMDSSLESMASSGRPSLPTLRQQLEYIRLGSTDAADECRTPSSLGGGGTLRRNGGPFITRSTSEKVPHRNEILAQVQRTAWARHTTK